MWRSSMELTGAVRLLERRVRMVRRMGRGRWAMFRDDEAGLRGKHERRDARSRISSTT